VTAVAGAAPAPPPWITAPVVAMAAFMEVLDTSIANVSLPHIAGNLSAGVDEATWILTTYLVANAIVLPLSAWFSSLIGRKNYYMLSVAIFTVSSCLCGFAPSLGWLVAFRILQGLGGGGLEAGGFGLGFPQDRDNRREVVKSLICHFLGRVVVDARGRKHPFIQGMYARNQEVLLLGWEQPVLLDCDVGEPIAHSDLR
jgi:hypothetical protein